MKTILIIIVLISNAITSDSQNTIGLPDVVNYTKEAYNSGTRNGDIVQDNNGIIYFANNEGLLSFDGTWWKTYSLPNKTMVRSVAIGSDKKIYAGGQNEMGYFSPEKNGVLKYHSLRNLLSEKDNSFKDVWNIVSYKNEIFFRTFYNIYRYNYKTITVYPASNQWQYLAVNNNKLIAHDLKKGLLVFENGLWNPFVIKNELPSESAVTSIISLTKDSSLVTTLKEGLFILSGNKISKFRFQGLNPFINERILSAIPVSKDRIAIGTHMSGCYIIDKRGSVIQNFSRKEGLQNNTIISLFTDKNHNLWAGLDNGIDFINYSSPIQHIIPDRNESAGYSAVIHNNKLYLGTATGLYQLPLSSTDNVSFAKDNFTLMQGTKGPTWGLSIVNGNLLLANHEGALQIRNDEVVPIDNGSGYWTFFPINNKEPFSLIAAGSYNGLNFFSYRNNSFVFKETLPHFNESVRFAAIDNNNCIWVAQTYKGVFKINLNEKGKGRFKLYTDKNGLPSSLNNRLYRIKNHIIVATEKGIYEYNEKTDTFEPSPYFKNLFEQKDIRYLHEDTSGNIWFIEGKNIGVIDFSGIKPITIYFPELHGKIISGFESIYPYNKNNVLVGSDKGFYHINYEQYKKTSNNIEVKIRMVKAIGKSDSVLFGGYFGEVNELKTQNKTLAPEIKYAENSLHFEYSAPVFQYQPVLQYSYRLKGFDNDWSDWSGKAEKDYTNLPSGNYLFEVRAKTNLGNISTVSAYSFKVLPPWYAAVFAYVIYVLLFSCIVYFLYKRQKKILIKQQQKHEEEQKHLQYMHQLELEKAEKEIIALKNEKLQAELQNKNSELASASMHLLQRGEVLVKIKEEVMHLKKSSNAENLSEDLKKVIRTLRDDDNTHKDWEQFASHFDNVHKDFLRRLKESHQKLTPNELKLSAFLRMNLSSKEIAQLLNISVRGVELSRYRLRKKLQIPTETNLYNFLLEFDSSMEHRNASSVF